MAKKVVNGVNVVVDETLSPAMQKKVLLSKLGGYKDQLNKTDYKVWKNMEYADAGKDKPYDPVSLHNERQALRDAITELESVIEDLD